MNVGRMTWRLIAFIAGGVAGYWILRLVGATQ